MKCNKRLKWRRISKTGKYSRLGSWVGSNIVSMSRSGKAMGSLSWCWSLAFDKSWSNSGNKRWMMSSTK